MTPEELMKPRYKVIADYPGSEFEPNQICIIDAMSGITPVYKQFIAEGVEYWSEQNFKRYPHLFKKLEWWEDRKPEDMPEYVKTTNAVKKVFRFVGGRIYFTNQKFRSAKRYYPATEAEYLSYLTNKTT